MEISDHMEISGHFGIRIVETMSNNELRDEDVSISGTDSSREDLGGDIAMGIESPSTSSVTSAPKEQNNSDNEEASVNDSFSVAHHCLEIRGRQGTSFSRNSPPLLRPKEYYSQPAKILDFDGSQLTTSE